MTIYRVTALMTISVHTDVEAASLAQAIELAEDRQPGAIWESDSSESVREEWRTSGELDGTPFDLIAYVLEKGPTP